MTSLQTPLTGAPVVLNRGGASASIAPLGAGLRSYERNGVALVETYGDDAIAPGAAGLTLAPWPNRVRDGKWQLKGRTQQLDITEVSLGNASHGLLRNTHYTVLFQAEHAAVLSAFIHPQHGYPFFLEHTVEYSLDENGHLSVEQTLANHGAEDAPVALGAHPYLRLGAADPADLSLTVGAGSYLVADEQLIPVGQAPAEGQMSLRQRALAGVDLNAAYADLVAQEADPERIPGAPVGEQVVSACLEDGQGSAVVLWGQASSVRFLHIFVTAGLNGTQRSVAVEPMSAPADALNSGNGLEWCAPGAEFRMRWGIGSVLAQQL